MNTYLHASRHEVNKNSVTKPGLKQRLVVVLWAQASEAISQHQIQKNFSGGACPQTPLASVYAYVCTRVLVPISRTNAILLPPGLSPLLHICWFHSASAVLASVAWLYSTCTRVLNGLCSCNYCILWLNVCIPWPSEVHHIFSK